ncbi:MAG: DUF6134 family protein [Hyphomonadaceae bacterium]
MRTLLIVLAALAAASPAQALTQPGRLEFAVTRNGSPLGSHTFVVTEEGGALNLRERARFNVSAGPLTLFRYEHDCAMQWRNGAVERLQCSTLRDGERTRIEGARTGGQIEVRHPQGATTFDAATPPTLFITPAALRSGSFIDTETGRARAIRITQLGRETVTIAGRAIAAQRYRVAGTITMDVWYDAEGRWLQGEFTARGQRIQYRLTSPLEAAPR